MPFKEHDDKQLAELEAAILKEMPYLESKFSNGDWHAYINGNYNVLIDLDDGTKIRMNEDDVPFEADTPESMDIKITNKCDAGCPWCHENSVPNGANADIDQPFIDTLHPYTEIAIGGGNVFEHPDLERFLIKLKELKCIPSITANQRHLLGPDKDHILSKLVEWRDKRLVYGVGISLSEATPELVEIAQRIDTSVIHVINGLFDMKDFEVLKGNGLRLLILGYKDVRRGHNFLGGHSQNIDDNMKWLSDNLPSVINGFKVASFDNLALDQLPVHDLLGDEAWKSFYMGDDGQHTFYIDMVDKAYSVSSTDAETDRRAIADKTIDDMFADVKNSR